MKSPHDRPTDLDGVALFHSVLYAYQRVVRDTAGDLPTQTVSSLCEPVVETGLWKIALGLAEIGNVETALRRFGDLLAASKCAERVRVGNEGEGFVLSIEGCPLASLAHDVLRPKDVTFPSGIIARAIAKKAGKQRTKLHFFEFTPTGARTRIEFSCQK